MRINDILSDMDLVNLASASAGTDAAGAFVTRVNDVILFPLIIFLMSIALLVFFYGCFVYVVNAENSSARDEGKRHILYGIIGLLVMLSALAILQIAATTFGLKRELGCADNPTAAGCYRTWACDDPDRPPLTPC